MPFRQFCIANIFALTLLPMLAHAEFAIINDPDGYVNLRDEGSKVVGRLEKNDVFWVWYGEEWQAWNTSDKWIAAQTPTDIYGSIAKGHFKLLSELPALPCKAIAQSYQCLNKNIGVKLTLQKFQAKQHTYTYYIDPDTKTKTTEIKSIDGKNPYGIDGWLPRTEIAKLEVFRHGQWRTLNIDSIKNYYELWNQFSTYYDEKNDLLYIIGDASDGAGGYSYVIQINQQGIRQSFALNPT